MARTKLKKKHPYSLNRSRLVTPLTSKVNRMNGISKRSQKLHQENCDDYYAGNVHEFGVAKEDWRLTYQDHVINDRNDLLNKDKSNPLKRRFRRMLDDASWIMPDSDDELYICEEED